LRLSSWFSVDTDLAFWYLDSVKIDSITNISKEHPFSILRVKVSRVSRLAVNMKLALTKTPHHHQTNEPVGSPIYVM
jgi:hypothetical protein